VGYVQFRQVFLMSLDMWVTDKLLIVVYYSFKCNVKDENGNMSPFALRRSYLQLCLAVLCHFLEHINETSKKQKTYKKTTYNLNLKLLFVKRIAEQQSSEIIKTYAFIQEWMFYKYMCTNCIAKYLVYTNAIVCYITYALIFYLLVYVQYIEALCSQ